MSASVQAEAALTMAEPDVFLDTNVLLYAVSSAPAEAAECAAARRILQEENWAISVQVLQEFYVNVTGKLQRTVVPQRATLFVRRLMERPVVTTTPGLFVQAIGISHRYRIGYWDAAIVAAAAHLGCSTLYTQDLNPGQTYSGVTAVDPF